MPGSDRPLMIIAALVLTAAGGAWLRPAHSERNPAGTPTPRAATDEPAVAVAPARVVYPFQRYEPLLKRNPFATQLPKKPEASGGKAPVLPDASLEKAPVAQEKKPAEAAKADPAKPPEPPDPLKDWTYSGTVVIGPDVYAVVENKPAKRSQYLKAGDRLDAATVDAIGQDALVLRLDGQPRRLAKSTAFNATPLAGASGGGTPGGPGGPGGPGAPGGPGGPGQPGGAPANPGMPRGRNAPSPAPVAVPAGIQLERAIMQVAPTKG